MSKIILVNPRLKNKIETLMDLSQDESCLMVKFKDLEDAFFFSSDAELQEFLRKQEAERFFDRELRKGYFDYTNENNETIRYHVESKRGTLKLLREEFI